jgi:hypothetical protein
MAETLGRGSVFGVMLAADKRMARHHRLLASRARLKEPAGNRQAATSDCLEAARRAASLPERRYLAVQAARLSGDPPRRRVKRRGLVVAGRPLPH